MKKNFSGYKKQLLEEKDLLNKNLSDVSKKDINTPGGWDPINQNMDIDTEDENTLADKFRSLDDDASEMEQFENRLKQVEKALKSIEVGNYGVCEICQKEIEIARLNANPASTTCILHK